MKSSARSHLGALFVAWLCLSTAGSSAGVLYYVHPALGDDANPGTNPQAPLRTLARAGNLRLQPGDRLLLAAGRTFPGELSFQGLAGTQTNPIVISSYRGPDAGSESRATIDAKGFGAGVFLLNCSHVEIKDLSITGNGGGMSQTLRMKPDLRCGVLVQADQPGDYSGFGLSNLVVRDVFFEDPGFSRHPDEVRTANGTQNYGWGIRFINASSDGVLKDISIRDCRLENLSHTGLKFTAPSNGIQNVSVEGVQIAHTGGPGVQMSGLRGGHFSRLDVNGSGSTNDTRNWKRGSGLWTWGSSDVVIEHSRFRNANGPGDSAGVHIDYNCSNVVVQYNLSAHNAGGFCEILGNNSHCAYRYNVSVNDGFRVKGRDGAFQEGKIFWLSGYTGEKSARQGPFNTYFYNHTIYVSEDIVAKVSVSPTARGVLIANNIFYIRGRSLSVPGDQARADSSSSAPLQDVVFKNNLFLRHGTWPPDLAIQDQDPIVGEPRFQNAGGQRPEDYTPANAPLVKNRGVVISPIPGDSTGLPGGLKLTRDILGQPIQGNPDLGAIEIVDQNKHSLGLK